MTRDDDFKRLVRARMAATGERYTTARAVLLRGKEGVMVPVTVEVRIETLTDEQARDIRRSLEASAGEGEDRDEVFRKLLDRMQQTKEQPIVLLSEVDGPRSLPIWIGPVEATSIALAQKGIETSRPLTHDLLRDVVEAMGQAREIRITDLRDRVFYAELLVVDHAGTEHAVSCRPSDGVAFGVRAAIPILVAEHLFEAVA